MSIDPQSTLGSLVRDHPQLVPLFDAWGLDYCCGGRMPFAAAAEKIGLNMEQVLPALQKAADQVWHAPAHQIKAADLNLTQLADAIIASHHAYTKQALLGLEPLMQKVYRVHGEKHPELDEIQQLFLALKNDLDPHLLKEENVLFPMIRRLDQATAWSELSSQPGPDTVEAPVTCMQFEHEDVGRILLRLAALTNDFTPPADGCRSFQRLYSDLEALEQDLHQHIHLENNILFPRALAAEQALKEKA